MPRLLLPIALLALAGLCAPSLGAEEESGADDPTPTLQERLGQPARPEAVRKALREARSSGTGALVALAEGLGHAGGQAAAEGLEPLVRHREEAVRLAALQAVMEVGLRTKRLRERTLRAFGGGISTDERRAAIEALGTVGDGRDLEWLLEIAADAENADRRAAFRALRTLTGAKVPYDVARWRYLGKDLQERAQVEIEQALDALATEPFAVDRIRHLTTVRRLGWVVLPEIRRLLEEWLVDPADVYRELACGMAADLKLADLAPRIERVREFAIPGSPAERAALAALTALGCPSDA